MKTHRISWNKNKIFTRKIKKECLFCFKEFFVYPRKHRIRFCSKKCYIMSCWKEGKCFICNKKFNYLPSSISGSYCSKNCWRIGQSILMKSKWTTFNSIYRTDEHKRKRLDIAKTSSTYGMKGKKQSERQREVVRQIGFRNRGRKHSQEWKDKFSINKVFTEENKKKLDRNNSVRLKTLWQNPEYREKTIKAQLKGLFKRPTSLESFFNDNFIILHNLPYRYVGNGSYLIGWKNPDFVNVNGEKICVEVANRYHHQGDWEKERIEHFAKYGWKCVVLFADMKGKNWKFEKSEREIVNELKGVLDEKNQ